MHRHRGKAPVVKHAPDRARIVSRSRDGRRKRSDAVSLLDESQGHRDIVGRKPTAHVDVDRAFTRNQTPDGRLRHIGLKDAVVLAEVGRMVGRPSPRQICRRGIQQPYGVAETTGNQ